ncbi:hypothetical protein DOY81_001177 [Sarcophaga bullata]|nr:hypothetical protein DOY81_001177 [Sarcophaga bullata]
MYKAGAPPSKAYYSNSCKVFSCACNSCRSEDIVNSKCVVSISHKLDYVILIKFLQPCSVGYSDRIGLEVYA